ncbi:MAG: carbamate kinase [Streptosporangiaceae bacterium]
MQTIVVAMGGNALARQGERGTYEEQRAHADQLASVVGSLLRGGYRVLVTHGNGPQVGSLAIQQEEGSRLVPAQPLSVLSAMTQGQIGHLLGLGLAGAGAGTGVVSVITHTVVDAADQAFEHPTKPVGPFFSEQQARALGTEHGWTVARDSGRGWRRVVPSPEPREIIEAAAIRLLTEAGFVVIASGGGGIPVTRTEHGLQGAEAVIDKDLSAALLAAAVGATTLVMLTDVDRVMLDFGSAAQRPVEEMTADEAERYLAEGQFPPGSMGPKITAAVRFLRSGGRVAIVTSPEHAAGTLAGTRIVLRPGSGVGEAA